jgi:putative oxidoreductase
VDWALLIARLALGAVFVAHGAQKLFGAFDGPGLETWIQQMGPIGYLVAIGEFFGGLGVILGVLPRFSAAAIVAIMIGAIAKVHWKNGFFLDKHGFEYNVALIGLAAAIMVAGPGRFALSEQVKLWGRSSDSRLSVS